MHAGSRGLRHVMRLLKCEVKSSIYLTEKIENKENSILFVIEKKHDY